MKEKNLESIWWHMLSLESVSFESVYFTSFSAEILLLTHFHIGINTSLRMKTRKKKSNEKNNIHVS